MNPLPTPELVNIVVTCTKGKRLPVPDDLRIGNLRSEGIGVAFGDWTKRISGSQTEAVAARTLYLGDHWSVVQSLAGISNRSRFNSKIWVCSAGYGLIGLDTKIKPYSASFANNDSDTVRRWRELGQRADSGRNWWGLLGEWGGPEPNQPRTVARVAELYPDSPLIVVASQAYLGAIAHDVLQAAQMLGNSDMLSIISTGTKFIAKLEHNLLPTGAALQNSVGGTLGSLNIRVARMILMKVEAKGLRASNLAVFLNEILNSEPPIRRFDRRHLTDQQIKVHIVKALSEDSCYRRGPLLRSLRDNGYACGQERFSRLFEDTQGNLIDNSTVTPRNVVS